MDSSASSQSPQETPSAPSRQPGVAAHRSGSGAGRWLVRLIALSVLGTFLFLTLSLLGLSSGVITVGSDDGIQEQYHSLARHGDQKVAIVSLEGTILHGEGFVKKQIDQIRKDDAVKAIVLRVNSPGGTVTASHYLYHHLKKLVEERELPLVVSMGGIAASGGYYVSMAVGDRPETIFAEPTTWTGSIGVIIPHYNVAGLMDKWQIEDDSIKSHRLKQMGTPTRVMTEEEREIFQGLVDDSFGRFKEIVKAGRPAFRADEESLKKVATGQVFTTRQALANGLVDKEGFIEDAIDQAIALAKLDKKEVKAVKYKRSAGLVDLLLSSAQSRSAPQGATADLELLLELASPRAYYLCTWLPTAAVNRSAD